MYILSLVLVSAACVQAVRDAPTGLRATASLSVDTNTSNHNVTGPMVNTTATPVVIASNESVPISNNKTSIQIVYSAADPDSMRLLRDGLMPLFTRPDILNVSSLELVPYGKATEIKVNSLSAGFVYWHPELLRGNITNVYRCPNGEGECESSLIHGCAVHAARNDPTAYVPFVACMAAASPGTAPEDSSFACSNSTIFMETLRSCALGPEGITLQHTLAAKAATTRSVPSIYINGQNRPFNVTASVTVDFTRAVCDAIFADGRMDRDACEGKADKPIVAPFESLLTQPTKGTKPAAEAKQ